MRPAREAPATASESRRSARGCLPPSALRAERTALALRAQRGDAEQPTQRVDPLTFGQCAEGVAQCDEGAMLVAPLLRLLALEDALLRLDGTRPVAEDG